MGFQMFAAFWIVIFGSLPDHLNLFFLAAATERFPLAAVQVGQKVERPKAFFCELFLLSCLEKHPEVAGMVSVLGLEVGSPPVPMG